MKGRHLELDKAEKKESTVFMHFDSVVPAVGTKIYKASD